MPAHPRLSKTDQLHTWWHETGVVNTTSRVREDQVRMSRRYRVQVRPFQQDKAEFFDSFVYEAIPRSGNGKIATPLDHPDPKPFIHKDGDGITAFEEEAFINMAWSQFLYKCKVQVRISSSDACIRLGTDVTIRPGIHNLQTETEKDTGALLITIPWQEGGFRFSVEFKDDLIQYRSNGKTYVYEEKDKDHSLVGEEPKNALLIFASPFLPEAMTPRMTEANTTRMTPGPIRPGDWGSREILHFPPGVYWLDSAQEGESPRLGQMHIRLAPETNWVHLDAGAYVKGAIEYFTQADDFYATGHGVLSGEHYVYQANPFKSYHSHKDDEYSLRMWWHLHLVDNQTWHCAGPTITAPPFNTMDFKPENRCGSEIRDYKQVGAYFFQTDGPQLYSRSKVEDVFYHANDDAIKTYHSNATVSRATIWKGPNDPVIQMGWDGRNVQNVKIEDLWIIHTRYIKQDKAVPAAIVGASEFYSDQKTLPELDKNIHLTVKNVRCEGPAPALLGITPLQNYDLLAIENVTFTDPLQDCAGTSFVKPVVSSHRDIKMNIQIKDWTIQGKPVTMENFRVASDKESGDEKQIGRLDIDVQHWKKWNIGKSG
ncbi:hypothetical protein PFICI_14662 [Pestalotiopsis fici W106-1]|uniref:Uncharacterized protein n=1 Tax=Pestalotiopsis fici (strain W106-1 / CGMCC3.15140) TaxID=1229662 RepID=W3WLM9_PESFW|nr:uncharacterized protein PFICI_14662 [Pestalotiopsis fici W106-1]ETS73716.1 hypothetical protein PFICI_14662 [Pestalotiopsis fici W106-1]